jgi:glycerol-3-phosphate dehydrogenase
MSESVPASVDTDLLIFGGGIAGLYLLNRFSREGYRVLLLETGSLGGAQTLHSQGIIHGGLKYALGGTLNAESDAIKEMPDRWRRMLAGDDRVDLRGTRILSDTQYMWSTGSIAARFTTFAASRMLRGRIETLEGDDRPELFRHKRFKGSVYKLNDLVVDTPSLLATLLAPVADRALALRGDAPVVFTEAGARGRQVTVTLADGTALQITAGRVILAAGAGNEALCHAAGISDAPMQRRPLHMVMMKTTGDHGLYAHCIGTSSKPRMTLTTHPVAGGQVWYLGGDIAETGVERDESAQIAAARAEVAELLPWVDLTRAEWATLRIDRAEPRQASLVKPDCAHASLHQGIVVAWPTKLTLAPDLGDRVASWLDLAPGSDAMPDTSGLPRAVIGTPCWETCF